MLKSQYDLSYNDNRRSRNEFDHCPWYSLVGGGVGGLTLTDWGSLHTNPQSKAYQRGVLKSVYGN